MKARLCCCGDALLSPAHSVSLTARALGRCAGGLLHTVTQGARLGISVSCGFTIRNEWPSGLFWLEGFMWEIRHSFQGRVSLLLTAH